MSHDMSTLPEVYHGPEYNPHNINPAGRVPEITQQGGGPGNHGYSDAGGGQHQSLPPYKDEYAQQVPQSPWTPPPQGYQQQQQQQQQPFMPQQQPFMPQQPQQQFIPQQPTKKNTICGMGRVMFWVLIVVLVLIIIGAAVGAGVSISARNKSSSWQPYPLQTGPWNINNVPLSQHNGICTNEYPLTAVAGCGPLDFPFIVNKVGDNYQISSSPYPELNGLLSAPVGAGDMYQRSFYSTGQPSSISSSCSSVAKVTVKLGKTYQYEISNEHNTQLACTLNTGVKTSPNQSCKCYWFGYLIQ